MGVITIFLTAVGLAMDAFAVSVAGGMAIDRVRPAHGIKFGLFFGGFQLAMPILGYLLGWSFVGYISAVDHWVAFFLLASIGVKMLLEAGENKQQETKVEEKLLSLKNMTLMAVATSIDALAVGISFAVLSTNIWAASIIIGAVAFVFSACGVFLGKRLGKLFGKYVEAFGGLVLIGIGLKILVEHLFFD